MRRVPQEGTHVVVIEGSGEAHCRDTARNTSVLLPVGTRLYVVSCDPSPRNPAFIRASCLVLTGELSGRYIWISRRWNRTCPLRALSPLELLAEAGV